MKLNIGAGREQVAGYLSVDIDEKMEPDIVADACHLPMDENTIDEVYASHILEHTGRGAGALEEWFRVLRPGGHLYVAVPDINKVYYLYKNGMKWGPRQVQLDTRFLDATVFGSYLLAEIVPEMAELWPKFGGEHKQFFIQDMLVQAVIAAGFDEVTEVTECPVRHADLGETMVTGRKFHGHASCYTDEPWCLRRRDPLPKE